ncbi:MAG: acyl-CoA thioesterase [Planctomycetota bacterium]|jgi:YbgC/YbaW family acyl-CoA thioester hydrolase
MAYEFRWKRTVEFAETDLAGIVHFSNYFRYMEVAEHEFLRSLGISVHSEIDGRLVGWPRVRAECSYRAPLKFEDVLEVHLVVRKKTSRSITYEFRFLRDGQEPVARGLVKVACVTLDPETHTLTPIPIPPSIDEKIEVAPDEVLGAR